MLNLGTNYDRDCLYHLAWPEETNGGFMRKRRVKQNVFSWNDLVIVVFSVSVSANCDRFLGEGSSCA